MMPPKLQVPLPCPSKGLVLTLHTARLFSWHKSLPMCSGCHLPQVATCTMLLPAKPDPWQPTGSPAGSLQHLLLTLSVPWGKACPGIGKAPSCRTPPPREQRVQAQPGHMPNVDRDAFYPHEMGPCGASPISKQHQVGPAALSQHQESCFSSGAPYCQPVLPVSCQSSSAHMFWDGDRSLNAFKCPPTSSATAATAEVGTGSLARAVLQAGTERISGSSPRQLGEPQRGLQSRFLFCAWLFRGRQAWRGHRTPLLQ